jgi:uncharacterized surface protein with fasciclin (FAS1) repeats
VAAFAVACLASGCASTPLSNGGAVAAATVATVVEPGDAAIVGAFTNPDATTTPDTTITPDTTATSAATDVLPGLDDVLAQDRFVPLAIALERSGLVDVLAGLDDVVLLAPTGTAFGSTATDIGIDSSILMNNPRLLEAVMRYHIVSDSSTNEWRTLNGASLDVSESGSDPVAITRVDGVEVLYQIPVRNGIVLVMPRLLVPTTADVG